MILSKFKQCSNCGNYFEVTEANKTDKYCNPDCYHEYVKCIICGNYFDKASISFGEKVFICSKECAEKNEYKRFIATNESEVK